MTDAQTEARAIAWEVRGAQLHRVFLDETEARELAGRFNGAVIPLVHATALAAKDAELAAERAALRLAADRADNLAAQLAEARKALEPFATAADNFDGFKIANDEEWFAYGGVQSATGSKGAIAVADLRAARRAREQGGE